MKDLREYYYKSPGTPDKLCELITENIIQDISLNTDNKFSSNIHTIVKNQVSVVAGKIYCGDYRPNTEEIVHRICKEVGYSNKKRRFSSEAVRHINLIEFLDDEKRFPSSSFIKSYGYACDETPEGLPLGYIISRQITHNVLELDTTGMDITTYVTIQYENNIPTHITSINIQYSIENFDEDPKDLLHDCEILFNGKCNAYLGLLSPTTKINTSCIGLGGPDVHVGSLSNIIMPTTFGNIVLYEFLGKSTTDIHRMSSLVARGAAKTIAKTHMCNECLIEVSYDTTHNEPSQFISKFNNVIGDETFMESNLQDIFHFNKDELNKNFNLNNVEQTTKEYFGHEYVDKNDKKIFPWERLDKINEFTPF